MKMSKIRYVHSLKDHNLSVPREIVPVIMKYFKIKSMIDMGGEFELLPEYFKIFE